MKVQPSAFLRSTLPLGIDMVKEYDSGRYHSIWIPDHYVSFWPDSIWTPEFTDLAKSSPSPHRHLDGMAVAAAAAVEASASCVPPTSVVTRIYSAALAVFHSSYCFCTSAKTVSKPAAFKSSMYLGSSTAGST